MFSIKSHHKICCICTTKYYVIYFLNRSTAITWFCVHCLPFVVYITKRAVVQQVEYFSLICPTATEAVSVHLSRLALCDIFKRNKLRKAVQARRLRTSSLIADSVSARASLAYFLLTLPMGKFGQLHRLLLQAIGIQHEIKGTHKAHRCRYNMASVPLW